jgi:hypothetical protein
MADRIVLAEQMFALGEFNRFGLRQQIGRQRDR